MSMLTVMSMLAELLASHIDQVGADKVAAWCTDNAPNMVKGRRLLQEDDKYRHIISLQCMMHGLALVLKEIMAHDYIKKTVPRATRLVTFFRASSLTLGKILSIARASGVNTTFLRSGTTRITSVHNSIQSVRKLEAAVKEALRLDPQMYANAKGGGEIKDIINDTFFSVDLQEVDMLLEPLTKVIMAVQAQDTTIADVTR